MIAKRGGRESGWSPRSADGELNDPSVPAAANPAAPTRTCPTCGDAAHVTETAEDHLPVAHERIRALEAELAGTRDDQAELDAWRRIATLNDEARVRELEKERAR